MRGMFPEKFGLRHYWCLSLRRGVTGAGAGAYRVRVVELTVRKMKTDSEPGYGQTSSDVLYFLQEYLHDTGLFAKKASLLPKVWKPTC